MGSRLGITEVDPRTASIIELEQLDWREHPKLY